MTRDAAIDATIPFGSLTELRAEHLSILRSWRRSEGAEADVIIALRKRIAATGAVLADERERETAQDLLDYWGAQLLSVFSSESVPDADSQIEVFQPRDSETAPAPPASETMDARTEAATSKRDIQKNIEASEQLRLSALARQWRQSNRVASYLLTGAALTRAAAFRQSDPEIGVFVAASERRVRERKKRMIRRICIASLGTLIILSFGGYQFYLKNLKVDEINREVFSLKQNSNDSEKRAYRLTQHLQQYSVSEKPDATNTLLKQVDLIDPPNRIRGEDIRQSLISALKAGAEPQAVQTRVADALVGNLMHPSVEGLTPSGVTNLLTVLSTISPSLWQGDEWSEARAGARRAAAWLLISGPGDFLLSDDANELLDKLKKNIGLTPAPTQAISIHFSAAAKGNIEDVTRGLENLGWKLQEPQQVESAMTANEVRYGAPDDKGAAAMLAADLRKCDFEVTLAPVNPATGAGTLDIRLAGSPTAKCKPAGTEAPISPLP